MPSTNAGIIKVKIYLIINARRWREYIEETKKRRRQDLAKEETDLIETMPIHLHLKHEKTYTNLVTKSDSERIMGT